jgi:hypothetical protein
MMADVRPVAASRLRAGLRALPLVLALLGAWLAAQAAPPPDAGAAAGTDAESGPSIVHMVFTPLQGDTVLYTGLRTVRSEGGRVTVTTTYALPSGATIQRSEAVYEAATLALVSWRMDDARSGEQEQMQRDGGSVRLAYRANGHSARSTATLPWRPQQIFSATVEALIQRDWAPLAAGQAVSFRLLVPNRLDSYGFRLQRDDTPARQRPGAMVIRMEPDSWLVRRLVDPLYFVQDAAPPHGLIEFRGRVPIRTDAGEEQDLRVRYAEGPG